ncbi:MAG: TonB-dependent receptor [Candidatus Marinimicrobia bacterium]|nr:TonB-dependent receptor [Candidatus Neomarinimicrobiota bacterium]
MKRKYISVYLIILFSITTLLWAQSPPAAAKRTPIGKLSGSVFTKNTDLPIEYAAITLRTGRDSTIVTGTITNQDGVFFLEKIPPGRYQVKISFIGYKAATINNVAVTPQKPEVVLATVFLEPVALDLASVTVTGEKKAMQYNLDKKIVTVDNNLITIGGTATDIMETIPSVTVDIDGSVSLRGSSSVTLLVDGRPSQIISLDEIPASMVERVEIVTNPSARYDPEGMGGIINIVLKKKRSPGYNGMVLLNAGSRGKYNGSINLNYRLNKINLFGNYDTRLGNRTGNSESIRESTRNDSTFYLNQYQNSKNQNRFHNFKLGGDYFINDYNTITLMILYNLRTFSNQNNTDYLNTDYKYAGDNQFTRRSSGDTKNYGQEYSLFYKKTFPKPQREWTVDLFYSAFSRDYDQSITQQSILADTLLEPPMDEKTNSDDANRVITIRTDYVHPLGEYSRFETGYRSTFRHNNSDYRRFNYDAASAEWLRNSLASSHFIYDENIHAMYGIYSRELGRLQSQIGLRIEQASTKINLVTIDSTFKKDYFSMFPSAHFRYTLNESQGLRVSYSRRVRRPRSWQISPFVDYSDPYNLSSGNPKLKPEYIDVAELEHSYENRKTAFSSSIFYRQVNGMITRRTELQEGGLTYTTFKNLNDGISYGLESVITHRFRPWWRVSTNFSYFRNRLYGTGVSAMEANESYSWTARLNSIFNLGENTDLQVMFFYFSPTVGVSGASGRGFYGFGQGRMQENYFVNLGAKHNFMDGKMSVFVRVSDILKTQKYGQTIYGDNFKTTSVRRRESRVIFFGISYKINEGIKERKRKTDEENGDYDIEEI